MESNDRPEVSDRGKTSGNAGLLSEKQNERGRKKEKEDTQRGGGGGGEEGKKKRKKLNVKMNECETMAEGT